VTDTTAYLREYGRVITLVCAECDEIQTFIHCSDKCLRGLLLWSTDGKGRTWCPGHRRQAEEAKKQP